MNYVEKLGLVGVIYEIVTIDLSMPIRLLAVKGFFLVIAMGMFIIGDLLNE